MIEKISSFKEFIELITEEYSTLEVNDYCEKDKVFFRGHSDEKYKLKPSIDRFNAESGIGGLSFENKIIKKAMLSNPEVFYEEKYPVNMLAKMQHYELSTRLLDISENALVGLYFACKKSKDESESKERNDGCIYCFKKDEKEVETAFSINVNLIASQYKYSDTTDIDIIKFWDSEKYSYYIPGNNKDKVSSDIKDLKERISKPIFFFPIMITEREKRQQAAFIIYPNEIVNNSFKSTFYNNDKIYDKKIIVDKSCKDDILEKLELLGIKESFLFPEVEKNCRSIQEKMLNDMSKKVK